MAEKKFTIEEHRKRIDAKLHPLPVRGADVLQRLMQKSREMRRLRR